MQDKREKCLYPHYALSPPSPPSHPTTPETKRVPPPSLQLHSARKAEFCGEGHPLPNGKRRKPRSTSTGIGGSSSSSSSVSKGFAGPWFPSSTSLVPEPLLSCRRRSQGLISASLISFSAVFLRRKVTGFVVRVSGWVGVVREDYLDGTGGRGSQRESGRAREGGGEAGGC